MISLEEYQQWMKYAKPGDWITYHRGPHLFGINAKKKDAANEVYKAAMDGELFVAQRRVATEKPGIFEFEYRAMKLNTDLKKKAKAWDR
jgi:hypothetical protein